jgi:hypothetical protein
MLTNTGGAEWDQYKNDAGLIDQLVMVNMMTDLWEVWTKGSFRLEGPEDDRLVTTYRDPWNQSRMWPVRNNVNDRFIEQTAGSNRVVLGKEMI